MTDPLAEVVAMLQPTLTVSKVVEAAGRWWIRRTDEGRPFFCAILAGACRMAVTGHAPIVLAAGDFVLIPAAYDYTTSSLDPPSAPGTASTPVPRAPGVVRLGVQEGPAEVTILIGHCEFGAPDAALLVSLLPDVVHVRGETRLVTLMRLVGEEARAERPARAMVLARLLEVVLIEALRSDTGADASAGLARALADARLAAAIRRMHDDPSHPWTVAELARLAALSRSAFFDRFHRAVGIAPMAYLLTWRMALAKKLLRQHGTTIVEVARRVGYGSASTFSVAFARHVGLPPARFTRAEF